MSHDLAVALLRPALSRSAVIRLSAAVLGAVGVVLATSLPDRGRGALGGLVLAAVLLAAGVSSCLDDPAATTLAPSPTSLAIRRGARVALAVGVATSAWSAVALLARSLSDQPPVVPVLMGLTLLAVCLSAAAVVGADAVLLVLLFLFVLAMELPGRWALLVQPGTPEWSRVRGHWFVVLAIALVALACSLRDPAARRLLRGN